MDTFITVLGNAFLVLLGITLLWCMWEFLPLTGQCDRNDVEDRT